MTVAHGMRRPRVDSRQRSTSVARWLQGLCIIFGSVVLTIAVLAAALAWGPHHCKAALPMVIGCAIGSYESLSGGMVAASAALFAGWLAWSAVQIQIAAEERRAAADRVEIESLLQEDVDRLAEGLSSIWKILVATPREPTAIQDRLEGINYGIERIADDVWLSTSRKMVTALGWERRRRYEELFDRIERLGRFRNVANFDVDEALHVIRGAGDYFELLRPDTQQYFEGLWRHSPKAWTLGYAIQAQAGLARKIWDQAAQNYVQPD
jgi:hypothetical protein